MKHILLFGAGKSATSLIKYLIKICIENAWKLTICDQDVELIKIKTENAEVATAVSLNVQIENDRIKMIQTADLVISMLPAHLHFLIALDCKNEGKNLLTASYIDDKILPFREELINKNLLFLYEMGLDPGIDHMSAMQIINNIHRDGGKIKSFKSHCGGLVAPESDTNPWHYKISWNPRNVVLAGKDGASYKQNSKNISIPYSEIFRNNKTIDIPGLGNLAWYPNRNSESYIDLYQLHETETFVRTTLRYPSFCRGWSKLINIGLTSLDDYLQIKECKTYEEWFKTKISRFTNNETSWNNYLHMYITDPYKAEFDKQMSFLGLQSKDNIEIDFKCSADILQYLIENKLRLQPEDKDMIVMVHEIEFEKEGKLYKTTSSLIVKGQDAMETAMSKTVGLPLGIAAKLILEGKLKEKGLLIPISQNIYEPVLKELSTNGIEFEESTVLL